MQKINNNFLTMKCQVKNEKDLRTTQGRDLSKTAPFAQIALTLHFVPASGSNVNPRKTQCIPVVKFFAFLELERN